MNFPDKKQYKRHKIRTDDAARKIGDRMLQVRERLGYDQAQASYFYGVSRATYLKWEKYGPPRSVPIRMFIRMVLRNLIIKANHNVQRAKVRAERQSLQHPPVD